MIIGCVVGGLAVLWGILVALLEQPAGPDRRRTNQLCTALLTGSAAAVGGGILATVTGWW